jgi:outer membrane protein OmpA-like peptidoglycan-associated protein
VKAAQGELTKEELKEVLTKKLGLSEEEVEEIAAEGRKQALLEKALEVITDEELKKKLLEKAAKGELTEEELKKILIEQGGLTEEEVEEIAKQGEEKALLAKVLKETTTLTDEEIKEVVAEVQQIKQETEELRKQIAAATSAEEVQKLLEAAGGLTAEEIATIVKQKEEVLALEQNFLEETLAKIFSRLKRNRELGIDDAFCTNQKAALDNLLVRPSYFATDSSVIAEETRTRIDYDFGVLEAPLDEYLGVLLVQIEGNADIRGTNAYNKALTERRWTVPIRLLRSKYFGKRDLRGLSRGEECQLPGITGEVSKNWWKRNRRTDYIFKLR